MKEIEVNRHFKSVTSFFSYCEKMCVKKGLCLTDWIESLERFENPIQESNYRDKWETCVIQPYRYHLYVKDSYNFIMEYDFHDEEKGFGYLYIKDMEEVTP